MKWLRIVCIFLALFIMILAASCTSQSYTRLDNFNGQFSIDYPKDWHFTSKSSENITSADFTGYINGSSIAVVVSSLIVEDFELGMKSDYESFVTDLLESKSWENRLVLRDVPLKDGKILSIFGKQNGISTVYLLVCGVSARQTVSMVAVINNASDNDDDIFLNHCRHMMDSLQGTLSVPAFQSDKEY